MRTVLIEACLLKGGLGEHTISSDPAPRSPLCSWQGNGSPDLLGVRSGPQAQHAGACAHGNTCVHRHTRTHTRTCATGQPCHPPPRGRRRLEDARPRGPPAAPALGGLPGPRPGPAPPPFPLWAGGPKPVLRVCKWPASGLGPAAPRRLWGPDRGPEHGQPSHEPSFPHQCPAPGACPPSRGRTAQPAGSGTPSQASSRVAQRPGPPCVCPHYSTTEAYARRPGDRESHRGLARRHCVHLHSTQQARRPAPTSTPTRIIQLNLRLVPCRNGAGDPTMQALLRLRNKPRRNRTYGVLSVKSVEPTALSVSL